MEAGRHVKIGPDTALVIEAPGLALRSLELKRGALVVKVGPGGGCFLRGAWLAPVRPLAGSLRAGRQEEVASAGGG